MATALHHTAPHCIVLQMYRGDATGLTIISPQNLDRIVAMLLLLLLLPLLLCWSALDADRQLEAPRPLSARSPEY